MKLLKTSLQELFSLFVDDGSLAVGILIWMAVMALTSPFWPLPGEAKALIWSLGLLVLLVENLRRGVRRMRARK